MVALWRCPLGAFVGLAGLTACAPTLDWRTVSVPDSELVVQLPCRPGRFQRDVVLSGMPLKLFMLSCDAGGVTYGVATADVADPTRVAPALRALADGARAAAEAQRANVEGFSLAGATPFPGSVSMHFQGVRQDSAPVQESVRVFGRGTRVFSVSAIGATLPDEALRPFEEGLHFDLDKSSP